MAKPMIDPGSREDANAFVAPAFGASARRGSALGGSAFGGLAPGGSKTILELERVSKTFGRGAKRVNAVIEVSLEVRSGESRALVGGSGSGKSTLARVAASLLAPDSGRVMVGGRDQGKLQGEEKRESLRMVQMVFQDPVASFDPRQTIGRNLAEPLRNFRLSKREALRAEVLEALEMVGLPEDFHDRLPGELSGGQCQRAAIARAVLAKPGLLICDEATSALDAIVQAQILNLLNRLKEEMGLAILLISHDLALVRSFCSTIGVMSEGRLVEMGPAKDVISRPGHPSTKLLLDSLITLEAAGAACRESADS